ncbi:MAG: hypothetical protein ACFFDR_00690 [Candidatus Thorarchaeota archaeon]
MEFSNDTRLCSVIQEIPAMIIAGKKIGPISPPSQIALPNWVIDTLVNHGYIEIDPNEDYASIQHIQNVYRAEDDSPHKGLQSIHPLLYSAINKKLIEIRSERASLDPKQYDEIEKLRRLIGIISQKRLSKILRVAISGAYQDKRKDMTIEERWLCEELGVLASDWKNTLFM